LEEEEEEKVETWRRRRINWRHGGGGEESEREGHKIVIYRTSLPPAHHLLGTPAVFLNFFHFFLKHEKTLFSFPILGNLNIGQIH
jgi:hypothetical protein